LLKVIYGQNCVRYAELGLKAGDTAVVGTPAKLTADGWATATDALRCDGFLYSLESGNPIGNVVVAFGPGTVFETDQVTLTGLAVGDDLEVKTGKLVKKSTGVAVGRVLYVGSDYIRFVSFV
jgi:hypothetical protein